MAPKIGCPGRRTVWLALALSASVIQVLGSSLPSLVVCHKGGRPPRVEFFSGSCSCSHREIHSRCGRNGHGAPGLGESCVDVQLRSQILLAARANRLPGRDKNQRRLPGADGRPSVAVFPAPSPAPAGVGAAGPASAPPHSRLSVISALRC